MSSEQIKQIGQYKYNTKYCLGEGSFGKVYEGTHTTTNKKVAIKQLVLKNFEKDSYLKQQIDCEIEILKKLHHPNIVMLQDVIRTQNSLYLVQEYCEGGDLKQYIENKNKHVSENQIIEIIMQIIEGFSELIKNNIIHRDLKPANILILGNVFKIADFGFARYVDDMQKGMMRSCVGSPLYMAPQILQKKQYGSKCDVWSLGVIFYELLFGSVMWYGFDEKDLLTNITYKALVMKKNRQIQNTTEDLLRKMLVFDEKDRISWEELISIKNNYYAKQKQQKKVAEEYQKKLLDEEKIRQAQQEQEKTLIKQKSILQLAQQQEQEKKYQQEKQLEQFVRELMKTKQELQFKNYIISELFTNLTKFKDLAQEEIMLEKFIFLNSSLIIFFSDQLKANLNKEYKKNIFRQYANLVMLIEKDKSYYQEFNENMLEIFQKSQILNFLQSDKDIKQYFNAQIQEQDISNILQNIKKIGFTLIKKIVTKLQNSQLDLDSRYILVITDYIIDLMNITFVQKKNQFEDIFFIVRQKSTKYDCQNYFNEIQQKYKDLQ